MAAIACLLASPEGLKRTVPGHFLSKVVKVDQGILGDLPRQGPQMRKHPLQMQNS